MITAIIIDDEARARTTLNKLIERHIPNTMVIGEADSAESGRNLIEELQPDLVFLDIEMPNGNGFDLLSTFEEIDFEVIFVTAYNQYAIKAFKFSAVDYILKPINIGDLKAAVKRASRKKRKDALSGKERFDLLNANYNNPNSLENKIVFKTTEGYDVVKPTEIIRCVASESYTELILRDKRVVVSKKIGEVEEMLQGRLFFRIHKSHLINLSHFIKYNKGRGGTVEMMDGAKIKVAVRKKPAFLEQVKQLGTL